RLFESELREVRAHRTSDSFVVHRFVPSGVVKPNRNGKMPARPAALVARSWATLGEKSVSSVRAPATTYVRPAEPWATNAAGRAGSMRRVAHLQRAHHRVQHVRIAAGVAFRRDEEHVDEVLIRKLPRYHRDALIELRVRIASAQRRGQRAAAVHAQRLPPALYDLHIRPAPFHR